MKQLAILWLLCAAAGFVFVVGMAVTLALTLDRGGAPAIAGATPARSQVVPGALQSSGPDWLDQRAAH